MTVEGEDAYCIDINTDFKNGYKTRADASSRMSADQISDVALSIEYVKQYTDNHSGISKNHAYLLRQLAVLSGSNQFSVSDKVIRGGVKIQKRDLETGDTKPQGSATLKDTAFDIISLNDNKRLADVPFRITKPSACL